jgi:hypothetical protein
LGRAAAEDPSLERQVPALRQVVGLRNRLIHGTIALMTKSFGISYKRNCCR